MGELDLSPLELNMLADAEWSDVRDEQRRRLPLRALVAEQAAAERARLLGSARSRWGRWRGGRRRRPLPALPALPELGGELTSGEVVERRERDHAPPPPVPALVAQPLLRHAPPRSVVPTLTAPEAAAA